MSGCPFTGRAPAPGWGSELPDWSSYGACGGGSGRRSPFLGIASCGKSAFRGGRSSRNSRSRSGAADVRAALSISGAFVKLYDNKRRRDQNGKKSMRRGIALNPVALCALSRRVACLTLLSCLTACGSHPTRTVHAHYNPSRYYPPPGPHEDPWGPYVREASGRFGVPELWIRRVMRQESGGQEDVISWAGAMGLMQVMPDTYSDLRGRYSLGDDPFDPHNNILAGTSLLAGDVRPLRRARVSGGLQRRSEPAGPLPEQRHAPARGDDQLRRPDRAFAWGGHADVRPAGGVCRPVGEVRQRGFAGMRS